MRAWTWLVVGALVLISALFATVLLIGRKRQANLTKVGDLEMEGPPGDREMSFFEHLAELRTRILKTIVYWVLGSLVGWVFYDSIWWILIHPIKPALQRFGGKVAFQSIFEPLMLKLQISLAAGLIVVFPLILYEILAFIWPALYPHEKRFALKLIPASLLLFGAGVYLAYHFIPVAALIMLQMGMPNDPNLDVFVLNFARIYMWSVAKIGAACGLVFQMPLVFMFLGKLGLVTASGLLYYWRHAVIAIFALSALITPTVDVVNMTLLAGPIIGLYFFSILLVALTQRHR